MKNLNKKGFTLIELLATVIILAIVLLIAVPAVINTIESTRKNAFKSSTLSIFKAAADKAALATIEADSDVALPDNGEYVFWPVSTLSVDNVSKFTGGIVVANKDGNLMFYANVKEGAYVFDMVSKADVSDATKDDIDSGDLTTETPTGTITIDSNSYTAK